MVLRCDEFPQKCSNCELMEALNSRSEPREGFAIYLNPPSLVVALGREGGEGERKREKTREEREIYSFLWTCEIRIVY